MRHKVIAERYAIDLLAAAAQDRFGGYDRDMTDAIHGDGLNERDHALVREHLLKLAIRLRDNLVDRGHILDGFPLPGEMDLYETKR